uniref:Profilin-III n=1 Tax=Mus musculus TaxID=10090 RepID=B0ZE73_MOUSE|nr:profilin-III [Mus musculus]
MSDWKGYISAVLRDQRIDDVAIVGHSDNRCVWASRPGGLLAAISPQEGNLRFTDDSGEFNDTQKNSSGPCLGLQSSSSSPVLMTFWMTLATWPLSRELSIFTRRIRQVQRTTREPASRMSPTARSGSPVSTKIWLPERAVSGVFIPTSGFPPLPTNEL